MSVIDRILHLFAAGGAAAYHGEAVSQLEHALQTAHQATAASASDELVAAALLHDIGHLLHGLGEDIARKGIDDRHEDGGAAWLRSHFGPGVTEPVRLHVDAKRYLCAVDVAYRDSLSPASQRSLRLQGGPFDEAGVKAFEQNPHAQAAVALRRWDDAAKVPGLDVPGLEHYRRHLEAALRGGA